MTGPRGHSSGTPGRWSQPVLTLYLWTPEAGRMWGMSDMAQASGGGQQTEWPLSRARQQREGWAGQGWEWGAPGMGIWGGVKRSGKADYWPCQIRPCPPPGLSLGSTTFSMLLNFPPQGLCPGHTLCLECPQLGNFWPVITSAQKHLSPIHTITIPHYSKSRSMKL